MAKIIIGIVLMLAGIALGLYVGAWVMFIGGIIQIVDACQIHPVHALDIGIGALRIVGASIVGVICFFVCFVSGLEFVKSGLDL